MPTIRIISYLKARATGSITSAMLPLLKNYDPEKVRGRIAVVAHGGVLDSFFRYVARLPLDQPRCFITINASLTTITHGNFYDTTRWVIETWGDTGHLDEISKTLDSGQLDGIFEN